MKCLLDTCILLWALEGNTTKLGDFTKIIINPESLVYVSIASYWEIAIKQNLGRIKFKENLRNAIQQSGFIWLNIEVRHIDFLKDLPLIHNDPFDRILIAQARVDQMQLLTCDEKVLKY